MMNGCSRITRRAMIKAGLWTSSAVTAHALLKGFPTSGADENVHQPLSIDPNKVPVSRFGSYYAISKRTRPRGSPEQTPAESFYVRCLQDFDVTPSEMFRIELVRQGASVEPAAEATPGLLTLKTGDGGIVEFCLSDLDVIRVRGTGCGLRLHMIHNSYGYAVRHTADTWEAMPSAFSPRIQVQRRAGTMRVDAPWTDDAGHAECGRAIFEFEPSGSAGFECSLHYYDATPRRDIADGPFASAVAAVESEFEEWAAHLPQLALEFDPARKLAAYVLWSATVGPRGLYRTHAIWGSKNWMTRIWSWDHCFVALGLANAHPELAWQQFIIFQDMQDPASGMLADWMTTVQRCWLSTKNPVHGWALGHLLRIMPQAITDERLREAYGPLSRWTMFWERERNLDGDGLPCILNPNESFDNTTENTLGGPVKPPETATYLVLQMEVLADVAGRLGYSKEALQWRERSETLLRTMLRVLWDDERKQFVSRRVGDGYVGPGDCVFPFVPLLLGRRLPETIRQALVEGLARPGRFITPYGLASEALSSPRYDGASYVKGPVWAPPNTFISEGLAAIGQEALAAEIRWSFCGACLKGGMSENFDARTGSHRGDPSYTWTAAMYLWLASSANRLIPS